MAKKRVRFAFGTNREKKIYIAREKMDPCSETSHKPKKLEGKYANHFAVGYNQCEFVFDFGQSYSESDQAELYSRIITSPVYAKAFLKMLQDTVTEFETSFGGISD